MATAYYMSANLVKKTFLSILSLLGEVKRILSPQENWLQAGSCQVCSAFIFNVAQVFLFWLPILSWLLIESKFLFLQI